MAEVFEILSENLSCHKAVQICTSGTQIKLSQEAVNRIDKCKEYLDGVIAKGDKTIYGINTGFGALHDKKISLEDLTQLQENLVMSHACGMGDEIPLNISKLMLLLKIQSLSYGHSGVSRVLVERLIDMFNANVLPVVYELGSLGASGDLAPLAHMSLPLIGLGDVYYKGQKTVAEEVMQELGWDALELQPKEGLALLNGTQFMGAFATWCVEQLSFLTKAADFIGAISLEAYDGRNEPFDYLLHKIRNQKGQSMVAQNFNFLLEGSELTNRKKNHVQDPYSFRCIPQVHGATRNSLMHAKEIVEAEINAVTDNPMIFPKEDRIISGGNFHGQPLALILDQLAIAAAELGSISERRIYKLISGERDLPLFLIDNPGLNSGFMIVQYAAASIVSQNKQLCTPASVDTIDSSRGQEDHVSMGANAATKCFRVIKNLERIMAIELLTAAQAIYYRQPVRSSGVIEAFVALYRQEIPFIEEDDIMYPYMNKSREYLIKLRNTDFISNLV